MTALVHHWDFHENTGAYLADIVGANTARAYSNGDAQTDLDGYNLAWTTGRNGGYAVYCNGATGNDYDYFVTSDQVPAGGLGAYSLAVWFKQASGDPYTGPLIALVSPETSHLTDSMANTLFIFQDNFPLPRIAFANALAYVDNYPINIADAIWTPYVDGNWHHIVGTTDGTHVCLYVDGALLANASSPEFTAAGYWRLFGTPPFPSTRMNYSVRGTMANARVYSGKLTADDITELYNDRTPTLRGGFDGPTDCVGYSDVHATLDAIGADDYIVSDGGLYTPRWVSQCDEGGADANTIVVIR